MTDTIDENERINAEAREHRLEYARGLADLALATSIAPDKLREAIVSAQGREPTAEKPERCCVALIAALAAGFGDDAVRTWARLSAWEAMFHGELDLAAEYLDFLKWESETP